MRKFVEKIFFENVLRNEFSTLLPQAQAKNRAVASSKRLAQRFSARKNYSQTSLLRCVFAVASNVALGKIHVVVNKLGKTRV